MGQPTLAGAVTPATAVISMAAMISAAVATPTFIIGTNKYSRFFFSLATITSYFKGASQPQEQSILGPLRFAITFKNNFHDSEYVTFRASSVHF